MLREMRSYREHAKEVSLSQFAHQRRMASALPPADAANRADIYLQQAGFRSRRNDRDDGVLIAAKAGSWNRAGYFLAHTAIVMICVGGLFDGDLPLQWTLLKGEKQLAPADARMSSITPQNRLTLDHASYRGNVFLPEGQRSGVAVINVKDGILLQDLPFDLVLKKFHVDFYSTGMPRRFASDVTLIDRATGQSFDHTIEVNKPLEYKGVTLYQASFDDGGSKLKLKARSLTAGSTEVLDLDGVVGESLKLTRREQPLTLELTTFRAINVENLSATSAAESSAMDKIGKHLGNAASKDATKDLHNVGPSLQYKLRDAAGQAREFHTYMQPVAQEGRLYFMTGVRDSGGESFRYLRIPAEDAKPDTWFALRALLTDPAQRHLLSQRFTASAMKGDAISETLRSKLIATSDNTLELFARGGYSAMDTFIRDKLPKDEQQKAAEVFIKMLQGVAWEGLQLLRERDKLPPRPQAQEQAAFVIDSLNAISDSFLYNAPFFLQMTDYTEVKASVIQVTRSPGRNVVYLGCALLVAGVCFMLYVRERRAFVLVKNNGDVLFAMSSNRKTLDMDEAFTRHGDQLNQLLTESKDGTGPTPTTHTG
jgi:cytochrome c biogenesis protein